MPDRKIKVILDASIGGFTAKMAAAGKAVGDTADKMTGASKESVKFRRGLDEVAGTAGKVGLAAAAGLGAIVVASANFDEAMSKVQAATHESVENMEALRKAALDAGADTVFSATEAAAGVENLAKAGVATADILGGGLAGALDLAAAGGLAVGDAAEIAATALTQFNLAGSDMPHVADLLAAAAGKAQGDVSDMSMALKQAGLVAAQMGLSVEETTGTLAAFASAGLLGSDAGTSFRTMLLRLANPSKEAADTMKALGVNAYDAQGQFVGMESIAGQLQTALQGQTQATRDAALATIFGSDAIRGASVLYAQGARGVQDWTDKVNDSGYAAETAAIRMDNLKGDVEKLGGALETALIGSGSGSQGPIRDLVQGLTGAVDAFNDLPPAAKNTTSALLGITAVTGGGLWFGSKVVQGVANTRSALDDLGVSAGRTGRLLKTGLAVGAVLEGLQLLDQGLDAIFDKNLDTSNLNRSLESLASGKVSGEIREKFGKDLEDFGTQARLATDEVSGLSRAVRKVPIVGGLLSGDILPHDTESAVENIKKLDEALAGMVESGQQEQAAVVFKEFTAAAREAGVSGRDFVGLFGQYGVAVDNASRVSLTMQDAMSGVVGGMLGLRPATAAAAGVTQQFAEDQEAAAEALKESREAAGDTAREFFGLGDSVNDAEVSLGGWLKSLEEQAAALRDFTENAKKAAKNGLRDGLIRELQAAGPEGAMRLKQLANASDEEIKRANKAWREGQKAIREYVNEVGGVPPKVSSELEFRDNGALKAIREIKAQLDSIPRRRRLDFYVNQVNAINKPRPGEDVFSGGGYTGRGGKYEPAGVVHRREYVFSAEATDGNEQYLDSLHRSLRGYANGGLVGGSVPAMAMAGPGLSAADVDRIAGALLSARSLYGDVYLQPNNYSEFKREMAADRQRAGLDGVRR